MSAHPHPPVWIGDKAAVLLNATFSRPQDPWAASLALAILDCAAAGGFRRRRALAKAIQQVHDLAAEATARIPSTTFAFLLDEHFHSVQDAVPCAPATNETQAAAAAPEVSPDEQAINEASFYDLISFALTEMDDSGDRYDDTAIANTLRKFDDEGRLQGVVRMFAARVTAEALKRFAEYGNAAEFVEAIRTGSPLPFPPGHSRGDPP